MFEIVPPMQNTSQRKPWYRILYIQVLIAVGIGILIGWFFPDTGKALKPLGDGFVKLVKMIIAPIIFCTVVHGIASMSDMKRLGRIGLKAIVYFEIVSTLALFIGLIVVNVMRPGAGFNIDPATFDPKIGKTYAEQAHSLNATEFLLNVIPTSFFDGLARGDILQVLLIAILSGFAISFMGERGRPILGFIEQAAKVFFGIMRIIVRLAPLGALGAMAFTVGSYGLVALSKLLALMAGFYLTAIIFVVVVLGVIAAYAGFSIFKFVSYIREELLLVLGTSSSETASLTNFVGNGVATVVISRWEKEISREQLRANLRVPLILTESSLPDAVQAKPLVP
jgi:aerobic C4-dicarboxylate transport protein